MTSVVTPCVDRQGRTWRPGESGTMEWLLLENTDITSHCKKMAQTFVSAVHSVWEEKFVFLYKSEQALRESAPECETD